ncbi:TetR/AcrR family transcriptional regulator [Nocardioides acrostichi]|uniref:TetR/AcrR family transcriptional regulator n=1 Tax=Nocardioides acrostichi TaxID=2784339 RepID=A0A930V150_9ACTN|nr:TetR/AcrR family transcriptional regulator [Nocardioides acrostichi]MBF4161805.1 TetR/AcrR family transcriptional regulator [Nocardioides acrostichi]
MTQTHSGAETRERLLSAATRAFAEHGPGNASLLEITRQAGQRNRGAVHYHFGSREGLLAAVLRQHAADIAERQRVMLESARLQPDDDVASVVEAVVRPAVELAEAGWSGRCFIVIVAALVVDEQYDTDPEVAEALQLTGGFETFDLLRTRMPDLPVEIVDERFGLFAAFTLRAIGDRVRLRDSASPGSPRSSLDTEAFVTNLIAMGVGMLCASS